MFKLYLLAQNIYTISNPSIPQTISIYHRDKIFNFPIVPPINYFYLSWKFRFFESIRRDMIAVLNIVKHRIDLRIEISLERG